MEEAKKIKGEIEINKVIFDDIKENVKNIASFKNKVSENLGKNMTEIAEIVMAGAFVLDSSDIHIEAEEENAKLRIRIDGVLHDVLALETILYKKLVSRIKLLSGLKLNVTNRPQDGRFSISMQDVAVEIRTSILPAQYGEAAVMRILNPLAVVKLADLGLRPDLLEMFKKEIQKPNGMIICTGPTGSGKTTTLYAFLREIANPEIKIITIEDPIEYHLEGISQTQVNKAKGYDFANGLRAIVRQDPDVVLVGEIRDLETTQIALQAALTGHLVLSTVHTNDAAGTIARLQALGEKPVNIAPAINIAIAQRLIRKVCPKCKQLKQASSEELEKIKKTLKNLPENIKFHELKKGIKIPVAKGCKECDSTGYRKRIGIFEVFPIDDEMEKFILKSPSIAEMREFAIKKGMILMKQDGYIKVLEGTTTLEEVDKVTVED